MTVSMRLGYLPLLDAAPLLVAEALGFARQIVLDLVPAPSRAALRDMLALGHK